MSKKLLFIFNPLSGKAQIKNKLLDIIQVFIGSGYSVEVYPTQKQYEATEIIYKRCKSFDKIVVSGGDGTLNECINGILKIDYEERPVIGYIPTGTANDFASNLKISKNMIKAADIAINGNPFQCDIGNFANKNFLYVAAFGAFTDVAYDTPQQNKNYLGHLAYLMEGIKKFSNLKSHKLKINSNECCCEGEYIFGMASNTNYVAGLKTDLKLDTSLNDGLFEVFLIKKPSNILDIQMIVSEIMTQNFSDERFCLFKTKKVEFEFDDEVPWTLDGEYGGKHKKIDITLDTRAVTFSSGI